MQFYYFEIITKFGSLFDAGLHRKVIAYFSLYTSTAIFPSLRNMASLTHYSRKKDEAELIKTVLILIWNLFQCLFHVKAWHPQAIWKKCLVTESQGGLKKKNHHIISLVSLGQKNCLAVSSFKFQVSSGSPARIKDFLEVSPYRVLSDS